MNKFIRSPLSPPPGDDKHPASPSRRAFIIGAATSGFMMAFAHASVLLPGTAAEQVLASGGYDPNLWVHIAPDGRITVNVIRAEMGRLRSGLSLELRVTGDEAELLDGLLAEALSGAGLRLPGLNEPAGRILVRIRVRELDLDNPGWRFARAEADLRLVDTATGETLSTLSRHARVGRIDFGEASRAAVRKLAAEMAEALETLFD